MGYSRCPIPTPVFVDKVRHHPHKARLHKHPFSLFRQLLLHPVPRGDGITLSVLVAFEVLVSVIPQGLLQLVFFNMHPDIDNGLYDEIVNVLAKSFAYCIGDGPLCVVHDVYRRFVAHASASFLADGNCVSSFICALAPSRYAAQ